MLDDGRFFLKGNPILFERDSPAMVRSLVEKSVRRWRWRRVESKCASLHQGAGGFGVHVALLFKLMRTKSIKIGPEISKGGSPWQRST